MESIGKGHGEREARRYAGALDTNKAIIARRVYLHLNDPDAILGISIDLRWAGPRLAAAMARSIQRRDWRKRLRTIRAYMAECHATNYPDSWHGD